MLATVGHEQRLHLPLPLCSTTQYLKKAFQSVLTADQCESDVERAIGAYVPEDLANEVQGAARVASIGARVRNDDVEELCGYRIKDWVGRRGRGRRGGNVGYESHMAGCLEKRQLE